MLGRVLNLMKQKSWDLRRIKLPILWIRNWIRSWTNKERYPSEVSIILPILLDEKSIYREVSELGKMWDQQLPEAILKKWNKWSNNLPEKIVIWRTFRLQHQKIEAIDFHFSSNKSIIRTAVALHAVIYHSSETLQGLVAAKSRLFKKNLTIPRLELVAMRMAANLCKNIKDYLEEQPVRKFYGWQIFQLLYIGQ